MLVPKNDFTYMDAYKRFFVLKDNPKRLVAKIYDSNEGEVSFNKSVIIPTSYYPLPDNEFRIFNSENVKVCNDERILKCFDDVNFEVGHCYQMSEALKMRLVKEGFNAQMYAGWLFVSPFSLPIFHAWVIVDDYLLDLSHDEEMFTRVADANKEAIKDINDWRELRSDFIVYCINNNISNSVRCEPVWTSDFFYIGSEVSCAASGKRFYNDLLRSYPNHECENNIVDKNHNLTAIQLMIKNKTTQRKKKVTLSF